MESSTYKAELEELEGDPGNSRSIILPSPPNKPVENSRMKRRKRTNSAFGKRKSGSTDLWGSLKQPPSKRRKVVQLILYTGISFSFLYKDKAMKDARILRSTN